MGKEKWPFKLQLHHTIRTTLFQSPMGLEKEVRYSVVSKQLS